MADAKAVTMVATKEHLGYGYGTAGKEALPITRVVQVGEKFTVPEDKVSRIVDRRLATVHGAPPLEASEDFADQANAQTDESVTVDKRTKAYRQGRKGQ